MASVNVYKTTNLDKNGTILNSWIRNNFPSDAHNITIIDDGYATIENTIGLFSYKAFDTINLARMNLANVKSASAMFDLCQAHNLDLGNWTLSNVASGYRMFVGLNVNNLDTTNWNLSKMTTMDSMFVGIGVNFNFKMNNINVCNVTSLNSMFSRARSKYFFI